MARTALHPPLVPARYQPATFLAVRAWRGRGARARMRRSLSELLDELVPWVAVEVVRRVDLTDLVTRYVDLNGVVAAVDVDAVAARLDVDAVVRRADLNTAAGLLDVDVVVGRVDIDAVLDRMDLTGVVLERVDLDALVAAVLERVDLVGLAREVIDAIDLPEIIRESTGSMASDTVRDLRMQGIAADEAVSRAVDRLRLRRGRRAPAEPDRGIPEQAAPAPPPVDPGPPTPPALDGR